MESIIILWNEFGRVVMPISMAAILVLGVTVLVGVMVNIMRARSGGTSVRKARPRLKPD